MGRFSRIFEKEEQDEIKPMYEHLDGSVEVLGFEHYRLSQEAFESSTSIVEDFSDSLEADIVLLETLSQQQRNTSQQDIGLKTPDYQGYQIDQSKINLSDDSKKLFMEKGIDYRQVVSEEGFVDKVKEIWEWIVDKIKSWWDKIFGGKSSKGSKTEENKEKIEELKQQREEAMKAAEAMAADIDATKGFIASLSGFNFNKYAGLFLDLDASYENKDFSLLELKQEFEKHNEGTKKFDTFISDITKIIMNQLAPIGDGLVDGSITKEKNEELNEALLTKLEDAAKKAASDITQRRYELRRCATFRPLTIEFTEDGYDINISERSDEAFVKDTSTIFYEGALEELKKFNKNDFVKYFEETVKLATDLVAGCQQRQGLVMAAGAAIKKLSDKLDKDPKETQEDISKIQSSFARHVTRLLKVIAFIQSEIYQLEECTAAIINLCTGFLGKDSWNAGGAIKDPHSNWGREAK